MSTHASPQLTEGLTPSGGAPFNLPLCLFSLKGCQGGARSPRSRRVPREAGHRCEYRPLSPPTVSLAAAPESQQGLSKLLLPPVQGSFSVTHKKVPISLHGGAESTF